MDGFKDSTKTRYAKGGSCYAKGGSVMKKANGGMVAQDASARRVRAEEAGEDAIMGMPRAKGDDFRKKRGIEVTKTTVRELDPRSAVMAGDTLGKRLSRPVSREEMAQAARSKGSFRNTPLIGGALGTVRDVIKEATGFKKGGLAAMPRGKKG